MELNADEDEHDFIAVINAEEQYSLLPMTAEVPPGWRVVGEAGTRKAVLDYIDRVWVDMRPLSLRRAMEAREAGTPPA